MDKTNKSRSNRSDRPRRGSDGRAEDVTMRKLQHRMGISAAALLFLTGCAAGESETGPTADPQPPEADVTEPAATATLNTVEGDEVGTVTFFEADEGTEVRVDAEGLEPGFYGFHIHGTGLCEPDSAAPDDPENTGAFLSAGGHLGVDEADHGAHAGDLPSLYVTESGQGSLMALTDGFTPSELLAAEDGNAAMIHEDSDNFANIPERYSPDGPDQATLDTGDAGARLACGVVE